MEQLIAWLVAFMVAISPPGRPHYIPDAQETEAEALDRYSDIAKDITEVLLDANEEVITRGSQKRIRMGALIVSVMLHESGFRRDVDLGLGKYARGDNGNSWCLMQLNVGQGKTKAWNKIQKRFARPDDNPEEVLEGWSGEELVQDRKNCIRAGLHLMVSAACKGQGPLGWLRGYASGSCDKGEQASRTRVGLAIRWLNQRKPGFKDEDLIADTPEIKDSQIDLLGLNR